MTQSWQPLTKALPPAVLFIFQTTTQYSLHRAPPDACLRPIMSQTHWSKDLWARAIYKEIPSEWPHHGAALDSGFSLRTLHLEGHPSVSAHFPVGLPLSFSGWTKSPVKLYSDVWGQTLLVVALWRTCIPPPSEFLYPAKDTWALCLSPSPLCPGSLQA